MLAPASADDLGARRRRLGISQQQLAELAGCSLSTVRLFEYGYSPDSPTRARVLRVLTELERQERPAA